MAPVDLTPKRSLTPDMNGSSIVMHQQKRSISPRNTSDRVLRSHTAKTLRLNYSVINNSKFGLVRAVEKIEQRETKINIVSHERKEQIQTIGFRRTDGKISKIKALVQKNTTNTVSASQVYYHKKVVEQRAPLLMPAERSVRFLSGIYPLSAPEMPLPLNREQVHTIGFRRPDGKISKINAFVQKNTTNTVSDFQVYYHKKMAEQVRNSTVPNIPPSQCIPALTHVSRNRASDLYPPKLHDMVCKITEQDVARPVYIKASEEGRHPAASSTVVYSRANKLHLPKIHEAFSKFNKVKPAPAQEHALGRGNVGGVTNCGLCSFPPPLERLYNYRIGPSATAPPGASGNSNTATSTKLYCTTDVPTAVPQTSFTASDTFAATFEQGDYASSFNYTMDEVSEDLAPALLEQEMTLRKYHEAISTSSESLLRQEQDARVRAASIDEMFEDAVELISQDGDYMERINMDTRMQCFLCSWSGAKFRLENHIRRTLKADAEPKMGSPLQSTMKLLVNHSTGTAKLFLEQTTFSDRYNR